MYKIILLIYVSNEKCFMKTQCFDGSGKANVNPLFSIIFFWESIFFCFAVLAYFFSQLGHHYWYVRSPNIARSLSFALSKAYFVFLAPINLLSALYLPYPLNWTFWRLLHVSVWYWDDGYAFGSLENLMKLFDSFKKHVSAVGYHLA